MAPLVHSSSGWRPGTLLAALMVTVAVIATSGCREPRQLVPSPDSEEEGGQLTPGGETDGGDTDAEAEDDAVVGGRGDGSGGRGTGGAATMAGSGGAGAFTGSGGASVGSGGASVGSGGRTGAGTGGAVVGGGSDGGRGGGTGTGGTVGSGGTGGVTVAGSGGHGSGGTMMMTASGGTTGGGKDAGADGAATCTGATGGKSCNGKCITSGGCCADGDCGAQGGGAAGKCDTSTNMCQYAMGTSLCSFDTGIQPWTLYMTSPTKLGDKTHLTFDAHNGEGNSGALKVEAPFDAPNQKVEFQDTQATPLDLGGRTIHGRVRLASGLSDDASHPGAIKLFAKSGANYDYASGAWTNLHGSGWVDVTLIADQPDFVQGTFSPGEVRQVGFELRVFSDTQRPAPATIFVDSIGY